MESQGVSKLNPLWRALFDKVKKGDVEEVERMVREQNIDVRSVVDEPKNFS